MVRGKPMCMSQHELMRGMRIPGEKMDTVRTHNIVDQRHIAVIRKGHVRRNRRSFY